MGAIDISGWHLVVGYLLLAVPYLIIRQYGMGLNRALTVSVVRMSLQLFWVGFYLEYLFLWNNPWVNTAWVGVMLLISSLTILQRSQSNRKRLFGPVFASLAISIGVADLFVFWGVLRLSNFTDASYLIPITGMLLGNSLADIVISLTTFNDRLRKQLTTYRFALANGATHSEALRPFMGDALKISINRGIANMTVMGLVSLPGMMTGQILGGSLPQVAIKYQIVIMLMIFSSSAASIFLALYFSRKRGFDAYLNPLF